MPTYEVVVTENICRSHRFFIEDPESMFDAEDQASTLVDEQYQSKLGTRLIIDLQAAGFEFIENDYETKEVM